MHTSAHGSIAYSNQDMEASSVPISRWRVKMCVYAWVSTHMFFSGSVLLRRSRSNDTLIAINLLSTQILVFKYHSPIKGTNAS